MIRFIAAIDIKRGIANEHSIPWQGLVPSDVEYYHQKLKTGMLLMGYNLYKELSMPYPGVKNYVAVKGIKAPLRPGFEGINDAREFLQNTQDDVWNMGGQILFESTFDLANELYLTILNKDFHCTKFFPSYEDKFELVSKSESITENDITFYFTIWRRKQFTKQR